MEFKLEGSKWNGEEGPPFDLHWGQKRSFSLGLFVCCFFFSRTKLVIHLVPNGRRLETDGVLNLSLNREFGC